jgi:hypothetical protein
MNVGHGAHAGTRAQTGVLHLVSAAQFFKDTDSPDRVFCRTHGLQSRDISAEETYIFLSRPLGGGPGAMTRTLKEMLKAKCSEAFMEAYKNAIMSGALGVAFYVGSPR